MQSPHQKEPLTAGGERSAEWRERNSIRQNVPQAGDVFS